MNLKTAGVASLVGFVLSFFAALLGGVAFPDFLFRAVLGALVVGGLAVAGELLLRSQLPDLFSPVAETASEAEEPRGGESVDIVLDDEIAERSFVEEIVEQTGQDDSADLFQPAPVREPSTVAVARSEPAPMADSDEPLEEIGSFLNSFRPKSADEGDSEPEEQSSGASPDIADYAPKEFSEASASSSVHAPSRGANLEGMEQDPSVLAKAIKTVMSKT